MAQAGPTVANTQRRAVPTCGPAGSVAAAAPIGNVRGGGVVCGIIDLNVH